MVPSRDVSTAHDQACLQDRQHAVANDDRANGCPRTHLGDGAVGKINVDTKVGCGCRAVGALALIKDHDELGSACRRALTVQERKERMGPEKILFLARIGWAEVWNFAGIERSHSVGELVRQGEAGEWIEAAVEAEHAVGAINPGSEPGSTSLALEPFRAVVVLRRQGSLPHRMCAEGV